MPNRIFPVPRFDSHPRKDLAPPSLALRIRTWLRVRRLDRQLAEGADPATSKELSLRAAQLRSSPVRLRFAAKLLTKLNEASEREGLSLKLQPHRREIRDSADDLLALVLRLRDGRPVEVQGMALTALLLQRGSSPFDPDSGESVQQALGAAHRALDQAQPAPVEFRAAA